MPARDDILSSLGLDPLVADLSFKLDASDSTLTSPSGTRAVLAGAEMMRSLHLILNQESGSTWAEVLKTGGHFCGKKFAADLDVRLALLGKPELAGLPLEACLVFIENYFAVHGLGRLKLDLSHAPGHGLIVARLENSFFADSLPEIDGFTDPLPAGLLRGFFEHISGQELGCDEIACAHQGGEHCTFVLTAPERLSAVAPYVGRENAEAIVARLCT